MTNKVDYTANGFTVVFPYPFAIPADSALEVRINDAIQNAGFHIHGAGNPDGGMVVFDSEPAAGSVISLRYLGTVSVSVQDASSAHLADKLEAGDGITLDTVTADGGVQRLRISGTQGNGLNRDANLSDLPSVAAARANLDVYSTGQIDAAIASASDAVSQAALHKDQNLADLADKATARTNLDVYSTGQTDTAIVSASDAVSQVALHKGQNLADLADKVAARTNLGVYSTGQSDAAIASATDAVSQAVLHKTANLSDVADPAAARANLGVYSTVQTDAAIASASTGVSSAALQKAQNLADLTDTAAARTNLGVYSTTQTDAAIIASATTVSGAALQKSQNLSDVADKAAARTNLGVYSTTQTDAAITASAATVSGAALQKSQNLADVADKAVARTNLGLDQVAYLNLAQDWTKPQRSQAVQSASVGGSVTLDFAQYQTFDLSLTSAITFANPTLTAAMVGQKGTIGITPNGFAIAGMGSLWKRVGDTGSPTTITGVGRIDYHIRALGRIEYAYNDVEA